MNDHVRAQKYKQRFRVLQVDIVVYFIKKKIQKIQELIQNF